MYRNKGNLIIVSGFSGAGKGTIMKELISRHPENYALSVSATSRKPRPGEVDGKDYFYKTREEFEEMLANDELLEHAEYVGNYYGTPKSYVLKKMEEGYDVILEIEIQGAMQIKKWNKDTILLFVTTPDAASLKDRLTGRGTETEEVIKNRLSRAYEEAQGIENYDYLIVNDDLDKTVERVHSILMNEHTKIKNNIDFIEDMRKQLKSFEEEK